MTSNVSNSSVWESSREVGLSSEKLEKHAQTLLAWEAATSDAILIVEANGAIASWNGGAERLFGYTPDEAVNLTFNCLVSESHRADEERVFLAIANGEVIAPYDTIRRCKGGTLVNVSVSRTLLRNVRGELLGFCEVVRHISEKKESKTQYATCREDVAQNNEHLSAALIAGKTGTYRLNLQTHEVHCDETLGSLYARSPSEIRSLEEALMAIHPEDRPWVQASCERCIKQGADLDIAYRVIWPDGSIRWISARGKTLRDELDRPAYLEGACVDITARRLIEGQLRDQRDVLRSIVSGAPLKEILEGLTLAVERNARRPLMASILLVDRERGRLMPIAGHRVPPRLDQTDR